MSGALAGCRVLDLSDDRGQLCGMILADLGADVICVEPPGGNAARQRGPFAEGRRDPEASLVWWSYARGKRSAVLDPDAAEERAALLELAAAADVWIESERPGAWASRGLGYEELAARNPGLVYVSISPFGQDGPKATWPATDLTLLAAGGPLWLMGDDDRPPVRVRVPQAFAHAAGEAAVATLVALHERERSGRGQQVDVSAQQAVTLATQSDAVAAQVGEVGAARSGGGAKAGPITFRLVYPARDGHVSITHIFGSSIGPASARLMASVCEEGFCDEAMRDKDWVGYAQLLMSGQESQQDFEAAKAAVAAWTATQTKAELLELAMDRSLLIAPVTTPQDVAESEQLAAREYWLQLPRPDGRGEARHCGAWARLSASPLTQGRRAPRLNEHSDEVRRAWREPRPTRERSPRPAGTSDAPLADIKILDLMWAIAGPMSTRMLSDYGATVVRIESSKRIDASRTMRPFVGAPGLETSTLFHSCNTGKRMMGLDLSHPKARDVVLDLVRWADVVCESFAPGTIARLGFDYETLREIKPDLIMLSTSLMGQTGPIARYAGYGNLSAAISGFFELTGWPDRSPAGPFGAYTDYIAPKLNASAILAALAHKARSGEGQHIDLSQAEAALHWLAPALLAHSVNRDTWTRAGNRDEDMAPHGCYPVRGEDAWIAIACRDDADFRALCSELGASDIANDVRHASAEARLANAETLDIALAARSAEREGRELEAALVARGVPAHRVLDSAGLAEDPQLQHRQHFVPAPDESTVFEATRSLLSRTPARRPSQVPTLGRDAMHILGEILDYDDERIAEIALAEILE